jgi:hypothetical protein
LTPSIIGFLIDLVSINFAFFQDNNLEENDFFIVFFFGKRDKRDFISQFGKKRIGTEKRGFKELLFEIFEVCVHA